MALLPRRTLRGQTHTITMMDLRQQPGEVLDAARDGAVIRVTKQGKHVATIIGANFEPDAPTIVHPDGTVDGPLPFTHRRPDLLRN